MFIQNTGYRVTQLEDHEFKVAYFVQINAASGTITIPSQATILLDQFPGGVDAYLSTLSGGQPTGENPTTGGGTPVDVSSFDAAGNYTLTGTPSTYPVAIVYTLKIEAKHYGNLLISNILEYEDTGSTSIKNEIATIKADLRLPGTDRFKQFVYEADLLVEVNIWANESMMTKLYQTDFIYVDGAITEKTVNRISDGFSYTTTYTYVGGVLTNVQTLAD